MGLRSECQIARSLSDFAFELELSGKITVVQGCDDSVPTARLITFTVGCYNGQVKRTFSAYPRSLGVVTIESL